MRPPPLRRPPVQRAHRARQDRMHRPAAQIHLTGPYNPRLSNSVHVAADPQRHPLLHRRGSLHQPVMLSGPSRLIERLWHLVCQPPIGAQNVGVPVAPLARAPHRRHRWHVHHVCRSRRRHPGLDPILGLPRNRHCVLPRQRQVPPAVEQQDLRQLPEPQRAIRLAGARWSIRRRGARQSHRPVRIGQKLRKVQAPRPAPKLQHQMIGRERHHPLIGVVVFKVIVIVLQEVRRRRPQPRSIQPSDLLLRHPLQHILVRRAQHRQRPVESSHGSHQLVAISGWRARLPQIPIDVVPVRDHRVRLKGQRPVQQTLPPRYWVIHLQPARIDCPLITAGAGVDQQPEACRRRPRLGKRRHLPHIAQRPLAAIEQLQRMRSPRRKPRHIELPEPARRVRHPPSRNPLPYTQDRSSGRRTRERCLQQQPLMIHGRHKMRHRTRLPGRGRGAGKKKLTSVHHAVSIISRFPFHPALVTTPPGPHRSGADGTMPPHPPAGAAGACTAAGPAATAAVSSAPPSLSAPPAPP